MAFALWRGIRIDARLSPYMFRLLIDPSSRATPEDLQQVCVYVFLYVFLYVPPSHGPL